MKKLLLSLIDFYRKSVSPFRAPSCRFFPTCSVYAGEAVERYGAVKGVFLTAARLLRCHPFHDGGYDPVPLKQVTRGDKRLRKMRAGSPLVISRHLVSSFRKAFS